MSKLRPTEDGDELVERWLRQYGDLALRTAYLLLGDRGEAEDAVQDAFLKAWRARLQLRDPKSERAWLMAIVANAARSQLRRRVAEPTDRDPEAGAADPFSDLELAGELRHALAALAEEQRQVVIMRVYLDLSVEETAAALGIPAGTVKSRLSRGLEVLRAAWTPTSD